MPDVAVLVFVAAVLVYHGLREMAEPSVEGLVLAWAGFAAVALLAAVAWRLSDDVRAARADEGAARADEAVKARLLDAAETTGQELIWEIDRDGVVTYMSGMARIMFGVAPCELIGSSVFALLCGDEQRVARELLEGCIRDRTGWAGLVFEALHADGTTRPVETTGVIRLDITDNVIGFTATTRLLGDDSVRRIAHDRLHTRISEVLTGEAIHTVFQPIVDLATGTVEGFEALSRFAADPAQAPDRWFADADQVGLGVELDLKAVEFALGSARSLPLSGYVSINVAPATLESDRLITTIAASGVGFDRVVIELTEHVSVDYQALREPLAKVRSRGVRLAVDDAGSGYASLRHILQLEPDIIKLDRDIVQDLDHDPARAALVSALVTFAHTIGATVTAEGVETPAERDAALRLGIDAAQGYLIARPAPADGGSRVADGRDALQERSVAHGVAETVRLR